MAAASSRARGRRATWRDALGGALLGLSSCRELELAEPETIRVTSIPARTGPSSVNGDSTQVTTGDGLGGARPRDAGGGAPNPTDAGDGAANVADAARGDATTPADAGAGDAGAAGDGASRPP